MLMLRLRWSAHVSALCTAADVGRIVSFESMLIDAKQFAQRAEDAGWYRVASLAWCGVAEAAASLHRGDETVTPCAAPDPRGCGGDAVACCGCREAGSNRTHGGRRANRCSNTTARGPCSRRGRLNRWSWRAMECTSECSLPRRVISTGACVCWRQGVEIQSELGRTSPGDAAWFRGHGYFWAGRPADAVPFLVEAATSAIQTGDRSHGSTQAALAAHVLAQVGEYDEVERLVGLAKD